MPIGPQDCEVTLLFEGYHVCAHLIDHDGDHVCQCGKSWPQGGEHV